MGSFLTFEFGPRTKIDGHVHGRWHLGIYLSNWKLACGERQSVDSDADRKLMTISARRLERESLTDLNSPADRDDYWIFFMPDNGVLAVGPSGIHSSSLQTEGRKR